MRIAVSWRQIIGAWVLVLLLVAVGSWGGNLTSCFAKTPANLHGVRIPQYDPLAIGPSPSDEIDEMELDEGPLGGRYR